MSWKSRVAALLFILRLFASVAAAEGDHAKIAVVAGKIAAQSKLLPFAPQREAAAWEFVALHHSELGVLPTWFKEVKREAYDQAIRELFHNRERLALIRAGDERQYILALEIWQVESQSQFSWSGTRWRPSDFLNWSERSNVCSTAKSIFSGRSLSIIATKRSNHTML